jgi:DNA repair protein RecO (recombination protein O)
MSLETEISGVVIAFKVNGENDALISVLTKVGAKYTFKAKGVLKMSSKNATACQMFTKSSFELVKTNEIAMNCLKTAKKITSLEYLYQDHRINIALMMICEIIDKATNFQVETNQEIYECLITVFENMALAKNGQIITLLIMTLEKLLEILGSKIVYTHCVLCQKSGDFVSFFAPLGGFICKSCNKNHIYPTYPVSTLRAIYVFNKLTLSNFLTYNCDLKEAKIYIKLLIAQFNDNVGLKLNCQNFIDLLF